MGSVHQVSPDGAAGKAPAAEINRHMRDEHKEVRGGISGEGQGLSEKDESNINEAGDAGSLAHQASLQKQQQQVVQWERFLPFRTLTVLLVENDDSTRQVLIALLHNCSYKVIVASNGLQAWKILEDLMNPIDLVLTEVVMPCLSGIGLLCKIMSHKTCKNIPVIMMSSNDSMGTVFKCLSKGAVDFLVKPVRKNELKNLWQHVWRRCLSSSGSGSGSESDIQTQKSAKSNIADDSDNNTGSNDEDDNGSIGLNTRDGSDNGSGTQISWTKCAVEVDSPQPMSSSDQLADPRDSTCAQVIHPTIETFCNEWVPMTASRECQEQKGIADNFMGNDLKIGVPENTGTHHESYPAEKVCTDPMGENADKLPDSDPKNEVVLGLESSNASDNQSNQAADLIGTIANSTDAQLTARVIESPDGFSKVSGGTDMAIDGSMELPSLELSLKRLRSTGDSGATAHDNRNILRRSDVSAFSRYNTSVASTRAPTGYGGSCSALDNRSESGRTESTHKMISNSNAVPLNQGSNGGSANNDMGSSTKNAFTKPAPLKEKMVYASSIKSNHPSAFHPMQVPTPTPQVMHEKIDDLKVAAIVGHPRVIQHQVQLQHSHHHYHHHHLHAHNMQQLQVPTNHDNLMLKTLAAAAPHCGPSKVLSEPTEGNAANYSLHGSNSGSNHGSNGQNGSRTAVNIEGINMESANGISERSGAGGGNWSGIDSRVDQNNRFAQREAALNKFRQKRKERNFQKKVRYQSRKKLAEQRPRVHGQFVRRIVYEHTSQEADS